jgi:hypothetical protein
VLGWDQTAAARGLARLGRCVGRDGVGALDPLCPGPPGRVAGGVVTGALTVWLTSGRPSGTAGVTPMGDFVVGLLIRVIVFLILLPVWVVVTSPVIWVVALFGAGPYPENVRRGYGRAVGVWGSIVSDL